jgi:hypothetical protein
MRLRHLPFHCLPGGQRLTLYPGEPGDKSGLSEKPGLLTRVADTAAESPPPVAS